MLTFPQQVELQSEEQLQVLPPEGVQQTGPRRLWAPYKGAFLLACAFAAFWPVWEEYARRLLLYPENRPGLVALLTVAAFLWGQARSHALSEPCLAGPAVLLALYALGFPFIHLLASSMLAAACLALLLGSMASPRSRSGVLGLMLWALPIIPSLETYLGYPMRVWTAVIAAPWLRLCGLNVVREGTCLRMGEQVVMIDVPCSGVHMLWTGIYIVFTLACLFGLSAPRTALLCLFGLAFIFAGNLLRSVSLFYMESGLLRLPHWMHPGAGIVIFLACAAGLAWSARWLSASRRTPCAER